MYHRDLAESAVRTTLSPHAVQVFSATGGRSTLAFSNAEPLYLDGRGSIPGRCNRLLFSTASRKTTGPNRLPTQQISVTPSLEVNLPGRQADYFQTAPR
jgi:hypothetical protein